MEQEQPQKPASLLSRFISKFAMTEEDDATTDDAEHEEHVHQAGCCSCHNNIGR